MKKILLALACIFCSCITFLSQNRWHYYFNEPVSVWEESIPFGNGRIGMLP